MVHKDYLSRIDMAHRWGVSRTMVWHYEHRFPDVFPKPIAYVNMGRTPIYLLRDVQFFEHLKNFEVKEPLWVNTEYKGE